MLAYYTINESESNPKSYIFQLFSEINDELYLLETRIFPVTNSQTYKTVIQYGESCVAALMQSEVLS